MKNNNSVRIIVMVSIIFAVIGPIIINYCYQYLGKPVFFTVWSGSEFLGYYGSVLGGVITFVAVYITINYENRARREERKLDARVFLTINPNIVFYTYEDFKNYANKIEAHRVYSYPQWEHLENDRLVYDEEFKYIME